MTQWLAWVERVHNWIYTHLADYEGSSDTGLGWFGYLRRDGTVFNACKGGNYKGYERGLEFRVRSEEDLCMYERSKGQSLCILPKHLL